MRRPMDVLYKSLRVLITVLMMVLVVPVAMQILSRYTGLIPRYIWTEEIARFCFVWIVMIGSMIAVRDGTHFDVDILPHGRSVALERFSKLFVHIAMLLAALTFVVWGWDFAVLGSRQRSEIAGLPMLAIYIAWPVAGLVWILFLIEKIIGSEGGRSGRAPGSYRRGGRVMSPGEVAALLFGIFAVLVILRVPVAFALGLAVVPVFFIEERLTPILLLREMFKSYNAFVLLAVPFFLLAANLMNTAGITDRLIALSRAMVGHLPGGLGHVNVTVSMLFAGISGSSTADAAGIGSLLIPQMKKEGYDASFAIAITACSSVMGVIIPPSILMVIWGGLMSVSIGGLFLAGVIPGILIAGSQMLTVYFYAKSRGYPVYDRVSLDGADARLRSALFSP